MIVRFLAALRIYPLDSHPGWMKQKEPVRLRKKKKVRNIFYELSGQTSIKNIAMICGTCLFIRFKCCCFLEMFV